MYVFSIHLWNLDLFIFYSLHKCNTFFTLFFKLKNGNGLLNFIIWRNMNINKQILWHEKEHQLH